MNTIDTHRAMSALVGAFFEAFATGIAEGSCAESENQSKPSAKDVKQAMLNHYGDVNKHFVNVMFYILARLNYDDMQCVQEQLNDAFASGQPSVQRLMSIACATDSMYETMTAEYRNNFALLLAGTIPTSAARAAASQTSGEALSTDTQTAVRLLVRTLVKAYLAALKASPAGIGAFRQATVLRMMVENANSLVNAKPLDTSCQTLEDMMQKACGSEANANVALNELNSLCAEMANETD